MIHLPEQNDALVIIATDDEDDGVAMARALRTHVSHEILNVPDVRSLMSVLQERQAETGVLSFSRLLVLIGAQLPSLTGLETLASMKADAVLRHIPAIVFSTSDRPEHTAMAYELGARACIRMPSTFVDLQEVMRVVSEFWLESSRLPLSSLPF